MITPPLVEAPPLILIIEDDVGTRLLLHRVLTKAGYDVIEARDGAEGLQRFTLAQPDIVLLDIMMPYMNGYEVARQIRARAGASWTPILMLTALNHLKDRVAGLEAGADDFLSKPCKAAELLARVEGLWRRKQLHRQLEQRNAELEQRREQLEGLNHKLTRVLTHYLPSSVAEQLLDNPTRNLQLGGALCEVTVLVADIRGFTRFTEQRQAQEVLRVLNCIWNRLVPLISIKRGTFDKYIGDAIMAFYGAPLPLAENTLHAVSTAWAMQEQFALLKGSLPEMAELGLGIGIATGQAIVGNTGSEELMDYTVIGHAPNRAQRLQEVADSGQILICSQSYRLIGESVAVRLLDGLRLKSLAEPHLVYQVTGIHPLPSALLVESRESGSASV